MSDEQQIKSFLKLLKVGKTIVFHNWKTITDDEYTKTENGFITSDGKTITMDSILSMNYRACDNVIR